MSIIDIKVKKTSGKEIFMPDSYDFTVKIELHNLTEKELFNHLDETITKIKKLKDDR